MAKVPKASGGDRRSEKFKNDTTVEFEKSKSEVIREAGFTPKQVERFQTIAKQKQKPLLFRQKNLQRLHTKTQ